MKNKFTKKWKKRIIVMVFLIIIILFFTLSLLLLNIYYRFKSDEIIIEDFKNIVYEHDENDDLVYRGNKITISDEREIEKITKLFYKKYIKGYVIENQFACNCIHDLKIVLNSNITIELCSNDGDGVISVRNNKVVWVQISKEELEYINSNLSDFSDNQI